VRKIAPADEGRAGRQADQRREHARAGFVNDLVIPCVVNSGCAAETRAHSAIDTLGTGAETFRSEIRAALATW
jgi:hypothetical protein